MERDDASGALLRYGIPDFKMEKAMIDRRIEQMRSEGVVFRTGVEVGVTIMARELREKYDAVLLAVGACQARELAVTGRDLAGVHLAMEYLTQQNRRVAGDDVPSDGAILASGKHVVVVGGGDTGSDCLGTAHREQAAHVYELAHGPTPPAARQPQRTWPEWPTLLRTYAAHQEGGERIWCAETLRFEGEDGQVRRLIGQQVEFPGYDGVGPRPKARPVRGGEVVLDVDLVLLAIGFTGVETGDALYADLGVALTPRTTVDVGRDFQTSVPGVFAAGDCVRGADLIVTAIADGRECARAVDRFLEGRSWLPARDRPRFAEA